MKNNDRSPGMRSCSEKAVTTISFLVIATIILVWLVFGESGFLGKINLIGSGFCHQKTERSPYVFGMPCPLCFRCTGLFLGGAAAFALSLCSSAGRLSARKLLVWVIVALFIYGVDGLKTSGYLPMLARHVPDLSLLRYGTGFFLGGAIGMLLREGLNAVGPFKALRWIDEFESSARDALRTMLLFIGLGTFGALILSVDTPLMQILRLGMSVLSVLAAVIAVIICFLIGLSAAMMLSGRRPDRFCGVLVISAVAIALLTIFGLVSLRLWVNV